MLQLQYISKNMTQNKNKTFQYIKHWQFYSFLSCSKMAPAEVLKYFSELSAVCVCMSYKTEFTKVVGLTPFFPLKERPM